MKFLLSLLLMVLASGSHDPHTTDSTTPSRFEKNLKRSLVLEPLIDSVLPFLVQSITARSRPFNEQ